MKANLNQALFNYCLRLGDSNVIMSQRLAEWTGKAPILEEDLALTNIALDLLGEARAFLTYAGEIENKGRNEDDLAFLRDAPEFKNVLMAELPIGDFAFTVVKQFLFSTFMYTVYNALLHSKDSTIAGIAAKSVKEATYHVRHSREWLLRLADGTDESRQRIKNAVDNIWLYTGDLFDRVENEDLLVKEKIAADMAQVKKVWGNEVTETFLKANIQIPENNFNVVGSLHGKHTEHLGHLLSDMQFLQRAYPGAKW